VQVVGQARPGFLKPAVAACYQSPSVVVGVLHL